MNSQGKDFLPFAENQRGERAAGGGVRLLPDGQPQRAHRKLPDRASRSFPRSRRPPEDGHAETAHSPRRHHHQLQQVSNKT